MAEEVSGYGFDVFVMDYRGYGQSHGQRSEARMHRDVEFCFDFIQQKFPDLPIIIYGRSLGSGFASRLASRRNSSGLVMETPFFNLIDVARSYLPFFPVDTLIRYKMRSDLYLKNVDCPIHIFHGTKDKVVRYSSAFKLFNSIKESKNVQMTTLVGGKHGNLNTYPLFRERLSAFFSEVLLLNSHRSA
jgi:alpha-beta hydrolase superfamily lysophospholipase